MITDLAERIGRYKRFFAGRAPGKLLILCDPSDAYPSDVEIPAFELSEFDLTDDADNRRYLDMRILWLERLWQCRRGILDDAIPSTDIYYGAGTETAIVSDRPVRITHNTSWIEPSVVEWGDLDRLRLDENNEWFQRRVGAAKYSARALQGWAFLDPCHFGPLDFANQLRGNQLFYDLYDAPERVHELMDFSTRALLWLGDAYRAVVGPVDGGIVTISSWRAGIWTPSVSGYLSEDAADLCSPSVYAQFGRPYTQRIIDHCGGFSVHHHGNGRQVMGVIGKLRGLHLMQYGNELHYPRCVEDVEAVYQQAGGTPLMISCTAGEVCQYIDALKQTQAVLRVSVDSLEEAQRAIELVRQVSTV